LSPSSGPHAADLLHLEERSTRLVSVRFRAGRSIDVASRTETLEFIHEHCVGGG
jgi:hypothetical protein